MLEKDATWVAIGFILFILLLIYFKIPNQITKILDDRSKKIKDELDEAKRLREEAQTILSEFQKKNTEAEQTAKTIIDNAKKLAKNYEKDAKDKFDQNVVRKKKLLDEKLNRLENDAINQIKDNITDIVLETVKNSVKGNNIKPKVSQEIIDQGIEQIGGK
ncbi:MAG: ATP F0F1 synthase subunit B [Rhodobiaceae bacterium]|nr:ATP F0F1 synthase subunit B [Rhodobiaceae bacterium]|tara:strand:- start:47811 stop:48293 length:483 start_codon:yes stop_codon:yes gene_type:complete